jgi:tetratricopeptide (TPR) repeat protein
VSLGALLLAVVVVPATVLVLAINAREGATVPTERASGIPRLPTVDRASGATDLTLERLPIVDATDGARSERFAQIDLSNPASTFPMLSEAWTSFGFGAVSDFFSARALDAIANNPDSSVDLAVLERDALSELRRDPGKARDLNDLAVASFALGIAAQEEFEPVEGFVGNGMTRLAAYELLGLGVQAYPDDRSLVLNFAVVGSVTGDPEYFGIRRGPQGILTAFVRAHPDDVTPRLLLSYLQGREGKDADLDAALATLEPLVQSPGTNAIGHLARGDAMLAHAETRRAESPMLAGRLARAAILEYDEAATHGGNPHAFAGRALALDMLGDVTGAIEAQQAAVEGDPRSASWWLRLAELQGCAGDQIGRSRSAAAALDAAEARPPRVGAGRLIEGDHAALEFVDARGFGGYSLGSAELPVGVIWPPPEGEGVVIDLDPFGAPPSCVSMDETDVRVAALDEALLAAIARRDVGEVRSLYSVHATGAASEQPATDLWITGNLLEAMSTDDDAVDALLAVQSRLDPGVASELCGAILREGSFNSNTFRTFDVGPALGACVAESAWRAGDEKAAHEAMQETVGMDEGGRVDGLRFLQAGMVAEATGETTAARDAYRRAAADSDTIVGALARLGDLTLTEGDPAAAIALYDLALAVVDQGAGTDIFDPLGLPDLRATVQHVRNNRSVARLVAADAQRADGIDCDNDPEPCELAQEDVEAALDSDPASWIYQMNAAYVARLQGDDEAARTLLEEALSGEPSTAWAIENDLGVLDAQRGARDDARDHLLTAIGARADYAMAPWNLGVLESSSGPLGFLAGQGWLAEAARLDRGYRTAPTTFRFDEAVFRIELRRGRVENVTEVASPAGVAAAVFASAAVVGSLAKLGGALVPPGRDAAMSLTKRALVGRKPRLRTAGRLWHAARRLRIPWSSWFVWVPALMVLGIGIAYSAVRAAPDAILSGLLLGAGTVALALITHGAGHRLVSRATDTAVTPARWDAGLLTGIGALIVLAPTGPFPAEALSGRTRGQIWLAALAGPIANCVGAAVAYALWWIEPLPALRALVLIQLMVAAYYLLPAKPLDGSRLSDHPVLTVALGFVIAAASAALALGVA